MATFLANIPNRSSLTHNYSRALLGFRPTDQTANSSGGRAAILGRCQIKIESEERTVFAVRKKEGGLIQMFFDVNIESFTTKFLLLRKIRNPECVWNIVCPIK